MRLAILASGGGSNLQSIIDAIDEGRLRARIAVVISNRLGAGALERAEMANIPAVVLDPGAFSDDDAYSESFFGLAEKYGVDFVALAGYLRRIPEAVVMHYRHRMVNIHPALLPSFGGKGMYGMNVHRAVVEHGVRITGATVHLVDEAYDSGPIVAQQSVPVSAHDSPEDVAARVLAVEHSLYSEALALFADGRVRVDGRIVRISPA